MIFWVGILIGGLFAWVAVKIGFYEAWAMLFNIVMSVYLGVFLGPIIISIIPGAADMVYSSMLAIISTAIVVFLILHVVSYTFFTGQFTVSFPRIFNSLGTAFLGFLAGFLVWSLVILLISMTPISRYGILKGIGFGGQSQQTTISYITWWCNLVHKAAASQDSKTTCAEYISGLMESSEKRPQDKTDNKSEPNKPSDAKTEDVQSRLAKPGHVPWLTDVKNTPAV
ncbi:MAG TPA: CvpA family protein [Sedimentisphaerales bacterium]|nr:CvpA family protein [Sedimentisphaerales bacterium]